MTYSKLSPTGAWGAWAGPHAPRARPLVLGAANGPGRRPRSPLAPPPRAAAGPHPPPRPAPPPPPPPLHHPATHNRAPLSRAPGEGPGVRVLNGARAKSHDPIRRDALITAEGE